MNLADFIRKNKIVLLDGAMGTELEKLGAKAGTSNLTDPDKVLQVHKSYANCGCNVFITNTLTMNRVYAESHGLDVNIKDVNTAGVKLAKQAAKGQYILGNLSSTGQMLEPYGTYKEEDFYKAFKEQADILAESGVDGFIIETIFEIREGLCALKACKDAADLPVLISFSFSTLDGGGRTIMGNKAEDMAKAVVDTGGDAVGTNCGDLDPEEMAQIIANMAQVVQLPIIAEPNAGKPQLIAGKTTFNMDADTFARGIKKCVEAGAKIIGGCCGTTPEHICKLKAEL
ncbi:hypothetical protein GF312_07080 [Candidatus Poribacteria bacterium]|nr:hypothetical protein [Candidatus Poribacteria bacterium]